MLDVARRNLAGFANVVFQLSDGTALALHDASVDTILANMYLHHCPDPEAAIRELVRVLKPGGRLVITDMDRHDHAWMRREMADEWLGFERAQIKSWLRAAGLVNILVDASGQSCCAASAEGAVSGEEPAKAEVSVFLAAGSRRVIGASEAVRANYGAVAEGKATDEGQACACSAGASTASAGCGCAGGGAGASASCCAPQNAMDQFQLLEGDAAMAWVNLCEDKDKVFEEAFRALKEGGRLTISDVVSDKPLPGAFRGDPQLWAGCVHGALPEQEYLDLVRQAGFTEIRAARSLSGGAIEGVQVYSLSVSARK